MDKSTMETLQEYYAPGGMEDDWKLMQEKVDPDIAEKYFEVLEQEGIIPRDKDALESYVLYSASSNQRLIEFGFAQKLDSVCAGLNFKSRPKVICADAFGKDELFIDRSDGSPRIVNMFKPGFVGELPSYNDIEVTTVSAKAGEIPLPDHSVNTLWDRLGAMWHYIEYAQSNRKPVNEALKELLDEYARVLKDGGQLIIDAGDVKVASVSTYDLAINGKEKVDFERLGWSVRLVGKDTSEIAVLTKIEK